MRSCLLLAAVLGLIGCDSPSSGSTAEATKEARPSPPQPVAPAKEASSEPTKRVAPPQEEAKKREVIRLRCKPGYSPCFGGRECCDDLLEVCGKDNHCHPLE